MSNVIVERFSLISFHRTDLATHLVIVPFYLLRENLKDPSGGGWSRTSLLTTESISHVRDGIGEIRRVGVWSGPEGQFLSFTTTRREKSNRGELPGRIFQLGISRWTQSRVSSMRSVHSRSRIFALDRRQTRPLPFSSFSPMYPRTISPFHSIFTFTSCDVYRNLLSTSRFFSPREIFALIPGEMTKTLPNSHLLGLTWETLTDKMLLVYFTVLFQSIMVLQNPSTFFKTSPRLKSVWWLKLF